MDSSIKFSLSAIKIVYQLMDFYSTILKVRMRTLLHQDFGTSLQKKPLNSD